MTVPGRWNAGLSTVEALIALMICAIAVGGGFMVNSHELAMVKSGRESGSAACALEERVEQLRAATWEQITDDAYLAGTYFAVQPKSLAALPGHWEQIEVSAWPEKGAAEPLVVEKKPKTQAAVVEDGEGLAGQRMARIDVRIFWPGKNGRTRVRDVTTIISNGGVSRMNLPGLGGGTSTPGPTPTPTPPGDGNGNGNGPGGGNNGNGRGNVAGKPGQN